ncbi:MAG: biopolymer transporter ExbD [Pirellulaceae bacterium]|nr:biopolymer transporter ExbD [Pirellulaceae bacterium]
MKLTSRSGRHSSKIELQMTSMIDCVFLLLIFFMVTSSFQKAERELDPAVKVERPSLAQGPKDLAPAIVEVVRGAAGFVYKLGGREFVSTDELTTVLSQFDNKLDGAIVRAADDAPFSMAAAAIQACKTARFANVSYVPPGAK